MKVLHYSLGLPPYRSGGLTKYVKDLMVSQVELGYDVNLLYPSDLAFGYPNVKVRKNVSFFGIRVFELKNPLTVPLLHGVRDPQFLVHNTRQQRTVFEAFLNDLKPTVVHFHTLMGIPNVFFQILKERNIRSVYTTHDYFGLCLKVNFINENQEVCTGASPEKCALCNRHSPGNSFLRFRNEKILIQFKKLLSSFKNAKVIQRNTFDETLADSIISSNETDSFAKALNYFRVSLGLIDIIHFNSSVTSEVFNEILGQTNAKVLPITHRGIKDHRVIRSYEKSTLNIGFIGSMDTYKGFPYLKDVLKEINIETVADWRLLVFGGIIGRDHELENINFMGKYNNEELENVFAQIDVLIVPSIWKETFSLITLEALSYGVPVIVSDNVGAKDIIRKLDAGFIFKTRSELKDLVKELFFDRHKLLNFNKKINGMLWKFDMTDHVRDIEAEFYSARV
ncbi:glycosyltransferase [Sphingobacterium siyangense]|uniref:glycosyltransferase n=1 Tax=Sphingobacterium siyangense TaxID=459529 RepID=UPI00301A6E6C